MSGIQIEVLDQLHRFSIAFEEIACDPEFADTALFCEKYGYPPEQSANAIVVASKRPPGQFVACLVLATNRLDVNGKLRELTGWKKASFAKPEETVQLTGMMIGGVTPLALPDTLELLIDANVAACDWVIVGAGSRSAKIKLDPNDLLVRPNTRVIEGLVM